MVNVLMQEDQCHQFKRLCWAKTLVHLQDNFPSELALEHDQSESNGAAAALRAT